MNLFDISQGVCQSYLKNDLDIFSLLIVQKLGITDYLL